MAIVPHCLIAIVPYFHSALATPIPQTIPIVHSAPKTAPLGATKSINNKLSN